MEIDGLRTEKVTRALGTKLIAKTLPEDQKYSVLIHLYIPVSAADLQSLHELGLLQATTNNELIAAALTREVLGKVSSLSSVNYIKEALAPEIVW